MNDRLPPELAALEDMLGRLPVAVPRFGLRGELLGTMRTELTRQRRRAWWSFAGGVAAVLALWCNLSWIASRSTLPSALPGGSLRERAAAIAELLPDIDPLEANRQARVLAGSRAGLWRSSAAVAAPWPAARRAL